jgi:hypothetical protein
MLSLRRPTNGDIEELKEGGEREKEENKRVA